MERWTVTDRDGREIYLTDVEWETHIQANHPQLVGRLDDVLRTIRLGKRKKIEFGPTNTSTTILALVCQGNLQLLSLSCCFCQETTM